MPRVEEAARRVQTSADAVVRAFDVLRRPLAIVDNGTQLAAPGQCPHCDRRRAADAGRQRKHREKRKGNSQ